MTERVMTVHIPDELYERIQEEAEASHRSPERVLIESAEVLLYPLKPSGNIQKELSALSAFSDSRLWAIVQQRLPWSQSLRLHELNAESRKSTLLGPEKRELDNLLYLVDYQMLMRAEALVLLKQRGHDVSLYIS